MKECWDDCRRRRRQQRQIGIVTRRIIFWMGGDESFFGWEKASCLTGSSAYYPIVAPESFDGSEVGTKYRDSITSTAKAVFCLSSFSMWRSFTVDVFGELLIHCHISRPNVHNPFDLRALRGDKIRRAVCEHSTQVMYCTLLYSNGK